MLLLDTSPASAVQKDEPHSLQSAVRRRGRSVVALESEERPSGSIVDDSKSPVEHIMLQKGLDDNDELQNMRKSGKSICVLRPVEDG